MKMSEKIGFMQGRLSPVVDGKIQAFPWQHWQEEFVLAEKASFNLMEWTLDQHRLYKNPLMTNEGQKQIAALQERHNLKIESLTGDCFMQMPFYKAEGKERDSLISDMVNIIKSSANIGIRSILIPLVDNGRLEEKAQEDVLFSGIVNVMPLLEEKDMQISFESDFAPDELAKFIDRFDSRFFGITYDIGNSAAFGFNPQEEIAAYGDRIINVHVKDRLLGGGTVALGTGDADIAGALTSIKQRGYKGNYILQTARAEDGDHQGVLSCYRDMVQTWLAE